MTIIVKFGFPPKKISGSGPLGSLGIKQGDQILVSILDRASVGVPAPAMDLKASENENSVSVRDGFLLLRVSVLEFTLIGNEG